MYLTYNLMRKALKTFFTYYQLNLSQEVKIFCGCRFGLDIQSILSDFVSILTWSRNFNGATPIEVKVA
jgi:hypothetical protein